jgi:hypothetical protein
MIRVHVSRKGREVTDIPAAMAGRAPGADAATGAAVSATGCGSISSGRTGCREYGDG